VFLFIGFLVMGGYLYKRGSEIASGRNGILGIRAKVVYFYEDKCRFPHSAASSALPKDWEKTTPNYSEEGWKEIKYISHYRSHFRYRMINEGSRFRVVADYKTTYLFGKGLVHSITAILTPGPGCTLISSKMTKDTYWE